MPSEPTLLRVLITRRHWQKFETFESQFKRAARELAGQDDEPSLRTVTVSPRQFERWYAGTVKTEPYPDSCRILEHLFGYPVQQLLAPAPNTTQQLTPDGRSAHQHQFSGGMLPVRGALELVSEPVNHNDLAMASEWPLWFGIRLAHLIALVDSWQGPAVQFDSLQALLHQEILMFDAAAPEGDYPSQVLHDLSRRQALATLAALPVTLSTSSTASASPLSAAATEYFLSRCAASLTACWHLLGGSDLATVDQMLSTYLLALEGVAQQHSRYKQAAARLASQAHRICGIVALHHNKLRVREHHCKQALYYATAADDSSSRVSALISLASTYFYNSEPAQAVVIYEQAFGLEAEMPPLQRSRVHAELSVVYGQLRREQDAIRSAGLAEQLYPDQPEQDRSFLYAEFTPASLTLEQGLAYVALAEHHPGRGYQHRAADIFARVDQTVSAVPDRIRFEIINHQARTAVLLNDLDAFEAHFSRALDGVTMLGSRQRQKEIQTAWQRATETWPTERRLKALTTRHQLGADDSTEDSV